MVSRPGGFWRYPGKIISQLIRKHTDQEILNKPRWKRNRQEDSHLLEGQHFHETQQKGPKC